MSDAVEAPEENDMSLTRECRARLAEVVECDRDMTVDELLYMAVAYESLAMRVATRQPKGEQRDCRGL